MLKFYTDRDGLPRVDASEDALCLASFLEQDVQRGLPMLSLFLQRAVEVEAGLLQRFELTGNAHTVEIVKGGVTVSNEFTEDESFVTLNSFKEALEGWRKLVEISR